MTLEKLFVLLVAITVPLFTVPALLKEAKTAWAAASAQGSPLVRLASRSWTVWFHVVLAACFWAFCVGAAAWFSHVYAKLGRDHKFIAFILFLLPALLCLLQLSALKIYSWLPENFKELAKRVWYGVVILFFVWALLSVSSNPDRDMTPSLFGGADQELAP